MGQENKEIEHIELQNSTNQEIKKAKLADWFSFERNEIFLLFSFFAFGTAYANFEPYAPFWLKQIFDVNSFLLIGLVVIIPSITGVIGTTFWGIFADKYGIKKFVLFGLLAITLMFFSLIFVRSPVYFLVILLVGNFLGSAQSANFWALAAKSISKPKKVVFAKITITMSLSWVLLSPLIALIHNTLGDNAMKVQLIIAVGASCIAVAFALLIKEGVKTQEVTDKNIPKDEGSNKITMLPIIFSGLMILVFFFQANGGFWAYTSIYFLDVLEVNAMYYSVYLIAKTALAIPLSMILGEIKTTKKVGGIVALFTGWMVISYILATIFPLNWILILIVFALPMYPISNILFYSMVTTYSSSQKRATAYGLYSTIGTIGYVGGILLLGLIADNSIDGIFVMLPTSIILGGLAFISAIALFAFILKKKDNHNLPKME